MGRDAIERVAHADYHSRLPDLILKNLRAIGGSKDCLF